ncbi:hypothetical protein BX600DRAFT_443885 [Xylariales sp. PMI_506]|nr:hypothetical protein BX600DRAFT_443885 [Xylariales sp. PMI_506]
MGSGIVSAMTQPSERFPGHYQTLIDLVCFDLSLGFQANLIIICKVYRCAQLHERDCNFWLWEDEGQERILRISQADRGASPPQTPQAVRYVNQAESSGSRASRYSNAMTGDTPHRQHGMSPHQTPLAASDVYKELEALNIGTVDKSNDLVAQVMVILSGVSGLKPSIKLKLKEVIKRAVDKYEAEIKAYQETVADLHEELDSAYE